MLPSSIHCTPHFLYTLHTTLPPFLSSPQHENNNNTNNNNGTGMTMYQNYYEQITVLWNRETERAIANNKLDITIRDNKRGTVKLMDVAIS
jgi:hypothetical protein